MLEGPSNSNDIFDLADVHIAMVDFVMNSCDGGDDGAVGSQVASEGDGLLHPAEWCTNGLYRGTSTWNRWCRGCDVFLVGVVELTGGGLIGVWEVVVPDADECGRGWVLYA